MQPWTPYVPDVLAPDGHARLSRFEREPWPRWTFALEDGTRVVQERFVRHGQTIGLLMASPNGVGHRRDGNGRGEHAWGMYGAGGEGAGLASEPAP